jgi:mercuric ion transport protein
MNEVNRPGNGLLKVGIIGTVVAALCCFTPVLVILFGVVGFSAAVGYLDIVLFPALGFFILLTVYALWRRNARTGVGFPGKNT